MRTVLLVVLFLDAALTPALLVADGLRKGGGGEEAWLSDQFGSYSVRTSSADLAVLALLRGAALLGVVWGVRQVTQAVLSINSEAAQTHPQPPHRPRIAFVVMAALTAGGGVGLGVVKLYYGGDLHGDRRIGLAMGGLSVGLAALEAILLLIFVRGGSGVKAVPLDDEEEGGKKKANIKRLLGLARPELPILLLGGLALGVSSVGMLSIPYLFGQVIDAMKNADGDNSHARHVLAESIVKLIVAGIVVSLGSFVRNWLFTLAGQKVLARLMKQLFTRIMEQETGFFDTTRTGELTNRLSNDCSAIQSTVTSNISMLTRFTAQLLGALIVMTILSPRLTGVMLSVVPVVVGAAIVYGRYVKKVRKEYQTALAATNEIAEETIGAMRTVHALHSERRVVDEYCRRVESSLSHGKRLSFASGGFIGFVGAVAQASVTLALWYGGTLVLDGSLSAGRLTSFLLYTVTVSLGFSVLSTLYGSFMEAVGASVRVFELIDRVPQIKPGSRVLTVEEEEKGAEGGVMRFDRVHFSYPSRPGETVLNGVDFNLLKGNVTALVGPSGGGKSTIISLIERFYDPLAGRIFGWGVDLRELEPGWVKARVKLVAQEPVLFACSVAENIRHGNPEASQEEVEAAAVQANADSFIQGFAEGYET
eukprot:Hpha_TRINITY_DN2561_c0_g1::TRINITY_DN2561_c0_g1_i1::g.1300::m.1300